jgi:Protein of unknown function (DUF2800)
MSAHAFLAPSSAHIWRLCPGSARMQAAHPEQGDKAAAAEGTAAHWVMQELIYYRPVAVGQPAENGVLVTQEMIDGAQLMSDHVHAAIAKYPLCELRVEMPVQIPRIHPQNWGTPDCRLWHAATRTLIVWDFKFGHDIVEAFENWQLIDYVAGCLTEINNTNTGHAISEETITVHMVVVQPRAFHPEGPIRSWATKASGLRDYVFQLNMSADEAAGDNPECKPHPVACEHCSARHVCDALQRATYKGISISRRAIATEMTPPALGLELRLVTEALQLLEARKSGLSAQVESLLRGATVVPHWTMQPGTARAKWKVSDQEVIVVGKLMGADLTKPPEAITPTQARDRGLNPELLAAYSFKPPAALKLAIDDGTAARRVFSALQ